MTNLRVLGASTQSTSLWRETRKTIHPDEVSRKFTAAKEEIGAP
jgi:hypothetical protein